MVDVIVLGSLNMDLVLQTSRVPEAGETIHGKMFTTIPGGKGGNQAAAIAKLRESVAMAGRVGRDSFGEALVQSLTNIGVQTSLILEDKKAATGIANILLETNGQNRILLVAGANANVSIHDVKTIREELGQAKFLVMQMEIPIDTVFFALDLAKEIGVTTVVNLAPACELPDEEISKIDYLVVNEIEAEVISQVKVHDIETAKKAVSVLMQRAANTVIITLGDQGAVCNIGNEIEHVPSYQVDVIDTTAAGDAFIGGIVVSLLKEYDLKKSVRFANAVGALATTKLGAQTSLPTLQEVKEFQFNVR